MGFFGSFDMLFTMLQLTILKNSACSEFIP